MKKTKCIVSGILCLSMVFGMTACDNEDGGGGGMTVATTVEDFTVDLGNITLAADKNENIKGKEVNYLGAYDITRSGDVKPAVTYFQDTYGATIKCQTMGDGEIMEKLAELIQSGDSPDLVDQRSNTFPYYIAKNTYMALDDYIDLTAPQWKDVAPFVEDYAIDGKHYYYPWAIYMCSRLLHYNRTKLAEYGLQDPKELYDKGQWDWDAFYDMMQTFVDKAKADCPTATGMYGSVGTTFIDTTGTPLVGFEDGKLVNNLNNANVDRAETFLENLKKQGLSKLDFMADYSYNNVSIQPVVLGYAAFQSVGDWCSGGYSALEQENPDQKFMFVPMPKDPQADKHYIAMETMAYLVPEGAKDAEAACVFINCMRLTKTDPDIQSVVDESILKERKYTDEQYEFWKVLQNPANFDSEALVTDFASHLDKDTCDKVLPKFTEDIPFVESEEYPTWTSTRESLGNAFNDAINQINAIL